MIGRLQSSIGTTRARDYAGAMAGFWSGLSGTLSALEAIAGDSRRLDGAEGVLRALQYRLHWSSELLAGVSPPDDARAAHAELANALVDARDMTGEVADTLEHAGAEAAADLLFEWRGALFRVRLARLRLGARPEPAAPEANAPPYSAGAASLLAMLGAVAFVTGAALVLWPIWAVGIALVAGGLLIHRP
jgi:hypothetical protein